jgi:hypothetical protein
VHKTKPKKIVACIKTKTKAPLFHEDSDVLLKLHKKYLFKKCKNIKKNIKSTPLSCKKKKSSLYRSSVSSSSLEFGINIGSIVSDMPAIIPDTHCKNINKIKITPK